MPLTKLNFKPGIVSDITSYSNEGGFVDGDKIRFRNGDCANKIYCAFTKSTIILLEYLNI
mgnify:CR=1 FL=1